MDKEAYVLIDKLAEKLGTTAEYLFEITVNQALISGLADLIFSFVFAGLAFFLIRVIKKLHGDCEDKSFEVFLLSVGCVVSLILFVAGINSMMTAFLNPEYWAFKDILKQLNK